jgi:hypothetical protein
MQAPRPRSHQTASRLFEIARVLVPVRPGSLPLVQDRGKLVTVVAVVASAYGVFGWLQIGDFDFEDFLLHPSFPF